MTVWLHEERSSVFPFGAPDQRTMFTPERIAIEKVDGTLVAERRAPRNSFAGHQMNTPWDPLHRAYFNGEALWTYLTTPFLLAMDRVRVEETEPWQEGAETWRVLRAYFPGWVETHCLVQDFFFGGDLMLRRHDYSVNIAGGFAAAQLTSDHVEANGLHLPTNRRAYTRGLDRRPILDMLMVSIISARSGSNSRTTNTDGELEDVQLEKRRLRKMTAQTMQVAILEAYKMLFRLMQVARPDAGPGRVLVRIAARSPSR